MDVDVVTKAVFSVPVIQLLKTFASGILVWYLFEVVKEVIMAFIRKNRILKESILSIDNFCKINGVEGIVTEITIKYVKLEVDTDDYKKYIYIPLDKVEASIKEKIQYKQVDTTSKD